MSGMESPSDPLFYLHHGYVDLLWSRGQAGFAAYGVPQIGGRLHDGVTQCAANTLVPGFSETMGEM